MSTLAINSLKQIMIMFLMIILGAVCYKKKIINKDTNKALSDLVLMVVNPLLIFSSYQRAFDPTLLKGLLISLVLGVATHLTGILVARMLVRGKKHGEHLTIERFAVIYSNCGFIGIPLVNGIFGSEGVFYITAYMTIFNLFVWTHGVIMMTGKRDKKTMLEAVLSPSVIATVSGFVLFVTRVGLPDTVIKAVNYIGDMNTPLAMLVAGVTIAQTDLLKLIVKVRVYYISILKLILLPLMMLLIFSFFNLPRVVLLTSVLAAGCPAAASINLFSIRYGKDYLYASELFAVTTISSAITVPLIMSIAELFV